jgi:hypothetical protein
MSPLRHLVLGFLAEAMEQGALTPTDPDLLARFLLDALHAILVPVAHQDGLDRQHTLASLSELLRQVLAPAHATASQAPPGRMIRTSAKLNRPTAVQNQLIGAP